MSRCIGLDADVLAYVTNSKPGVGATKKTPGAGFKRPWPPCGEEALGERRPTLIKMDAAVKAKVEKLFGMP